MDKKAAASKIVPGILIFCGIPILLYVTGIGCPIKFWTGVSCPGCGMTRAWLAALSGRVPGMHAKPHGATAAGAPGDVQDWPKVVAAARKAGVKWFVVECEKRKGTYDDVAASAAYLKPLLGGGL